MADLGSTKSALWKAPQWRPGDQFDSGHGSLTPVNAFARSIMVIINNLSGFYIFWMRPPQLNLNSFFFYCNQDGSLSPAPKFQLVAPLSSWTTKLKGLIVFCSLEILRMCNFNFQFLIAQFLSHTYDVCMVLVP